MKQLFFLKVLLILAATLSIQSGLYAANSGKSGNDGFEEMDGNTPTQTSQTSGNDAKVVVDTTKSQTSGLQETEETEEQSVYPIIPLSGSCIAFYVFTWLLARFGIFKTSTHRKIWNTVLLISFLVSGILGLMLVIQINYNVLNKWFSSFMWLHVDFGIVMAITAIFHTCWHYKYYATLLKKKKQNA